jgi:hypothetical protein
MIRAVCSVSRAVSRITAVGAVHVVGPALPRVRLASTAGAKKRKLVLSSKAPPRFKMKADESAPLFKDVFRKFMARIHPDLFTRHPELQKQNSDSMQQLLEVLGQAKSGTYETELPILRKTLVFYVRTDTADHFKKIPLELRTTGSNCHNVVAKSMAELFGHCGLPTSFRWGDEYWKRTVKLPERRDEEQDE